MSEAYRLSFRIRRKYFEAIRRGDKLNEIRRCCEYWNKRVRKADDRLLYGVPVIAVLVCGKEKMEKIVKRITMFDNAVEALGQQEAGQTVKDVGTGPVWAFWFG